MGLLKSLYPFQTKARHKTKTCCTCGMTKGLSCFGILKASKDGYRGKCRDCRKIEVVKRKAEQSEYNKRYYLENLAAEKSRHAEYQIKNRDLIRTRARKYYSKNRELCLLRAEKYREENKEMTINATKKWRAKSYDKISAYGSKYRAENRDSVNRSFREYINNRQKIDPEFMMRLKIRSRFKSAVKNGWRTRFEETGFLYSDYVDYFELTQPGMIAKYLKTGLYHIDHIIPVSAYDMTNSSDVAKCWNPRNMRIIPKEINLSKKDKVDMGLIDSLGLCDLIPNYTEGEKEAARERL